MKPINEMSLNECLWVICNPMEASTQYTSTEILKQFANRIYELTRWIPVDEAGVIAVGISENTKPPLTATEQAMFVAGFQECIKYLNKTFKPEGV